MSEKKEYITKDEAISAIHTGFWTDIRIDKNINAIPAAEVEPVVRARWENHFGEKICSACMGATPIFANIRNHKYENCKQYETEFCPHCGARMKRSGSGE